jgi:hypothetical protein
MAYNDSLCIIRVLLHHRPSHVDVGVDQPFAKHSRNRCRVGIHSFPAIQAFAEPDVIAVKITPSSTEAVRQGFSSLGYEKEMLVTEAAKRLSIAWLCL